MQQSSATPSLHLGFWGLRKIVACSKSSSQCLLVATIFGTVSSLHPTSFLMIFTLVHISIGVGISWCSVVECCRVWCCGGSGWSERSLLSSFCLSLRRPLLEMDGGISDPLVDGHKSRQQK